MQTTLLDSCEALLAMLDAGPATDSIQVDVFDQWRNPDARTALCGVTWTRACHNKPEPA